MAEKRGVFTLATIGLLLLTACGGGSKESTTAPAETKPAATAAPPAGGGGVFDPSKGSAVISGTVKLEGAAPTMDKIKMNSDAECMKLHATPATFQEVVVEANGALQNVFVYVKEGLSQWKFTSPTEPVQIDQLGCLYTPHVFGIQVNQPLKILNSDPTLHNIHSYAEKNRPFNLGQPMKGMTNTKTFDVPEIMVKIRCDVHKWMAAYLGVLDHPFFSVTSPDGSFSLKNLPAGQYVIEAWHEKYGTQTQTISVGDKETKTVSFTFKAS